MGPGLAGQLIPGEWAVAQSLVQTELVAQIDRPRVDEPEHGPEDTLGHGVGGLADGWFGSRCHVLFLVPLTLMVGYVVLTPTRRRR